MGRCGQIWGDMGRCLVPAVLIANHALTEQLIRIGGMTFLCEGEVACIQAAFFQAVDERELCLGLGEGGGRLRGMYGDVWRCMKMCGDLSDLVLCWGDTSSE